MISVSWNLWYCYIRGQESVATFIAKHRRDPLLFSSHLFICKSLYHLDTAPESNHDVKSVWTGFQIFNETMYPCLDSAVQSFCTAVICR